MVACGMLVNVLFVIRRMDIYRCTEHCLMVPGYQYSQKLVQTTLVCTVILSFAKMFTTPNEETSN